NRGDLDYRETIHLCVSEVAKGAVRRCDRSEIFDCHPVNGKSKRGQEERSAPEKAAHESNAKTENHGRSDKVENDHLPGQFHLLPDVIPLVRFADKPRYRTDQKSDATAKSRRNCEHRNRRQPKRPPNRMEPGAKI